MRFKIEALAIAALAAAGAFYSTVRAQPAPPPQEESEQTSRSVWDGVYTEEQSRRGETLSRKECATCHGVGLTGGEAAPALSGDAFLSNWNGLTVGDLFDRIR